MTFDPEYLYRRMGGLHGEHPPPQRLFVAFSGGLDSTALLHAASRLPSAPPVIAVHVNHGLSPDADAWAVHAERFAGELEIEFRGLTVSVDRAAGLGAEAAAREARYAAIAGLLGAGDWLLSAHHRDDQAETLLLNLLRGSGTLGLAAMPETRALGDGLLVRPLLDLPRSALRDYAKRQSLTWIEDSSNRDVRFDRNFLRHEVLPLLESRWPSAGASLARSAGLAAEAEQLTGQLACLDALHCAGRYEHRLDLEPFGGLPPERQRNLLRWLCRKLGLPQPPMTRLYEIQASLLPAAGDATPAVCWPGAEARRYRDELFLLPPLPEAPAEGIILAPGRPADLGPLGRLSLEPAASGGIPEAAASEGLRVDFRRGGERIRLAPRAKTQRVKTLMQSAGVLPWMRDRVPLLFAGQRLVAIGDRWCAEGEGESPGYRVIWSGRPELD